MLDYFLELDNRLLLAINGMHNAYFDQFMWLVSDKWIWIPLYCALAYALGKRFGWRGLLATLVAAGITFAVTDHVCIQVLRFAFNRLRPTCPDNPISPFVHIVNGYTSGRWGFPSAHAANTTGLAIVLGFAFRRRRMTVLLTAWVMLVCYSRMYLGVHYLSDLLGGAFFGATVGYLSSWVLRRSSILAEDKQNYCNELVPISVGGLILLTIAISAACG